MSEEKLKATPDAASIVLNAVGGSTPKDPEAEQLGFNHLETFIDPSTKVTVCTLKAIRIWGGRGQGYDEKSGDVIASYVKAELDQLLKMIDRNRIVLDMGNVIFVSTAFLQCLRYAR